MKSVQRVALSQKLNGFRHLKRELPAFQYFKTKAPCLFSLKAQTHRKPSELNRSAQERKAVVGHAHPCPILPYPGMKVKEIENINNNKAFITCAAFSFIQNRNSKPSSTRPRLREETILSMQ